MPQEQYGTPPTDRPSSSLRNLSAYLTLANARDKLGFDPASFGLTEQEAGNIAYAFSVYDTNDNGRLDLSELSTLWCAPGRAVRLNFVSKEAGGGQTPISLQSLPTAPTWRKLNSFELSTKRPWCM